MAKRAYEAEKQRVSEVADDVISKLETARSSFEAFPKVINRVSNETYVAHLREFFLYIFGLKLIWGIFTGYRPTFVYPNQAKIQEEIDRYRYLAKDVTNDIARLEGFDFSKELVNEIQALGEGLEVVLNDIKQAPKNLVVLRERYSKALSAFDALKKRYLSENPDDVGLSKRSDPLASTADIALQDSTEAVELAASKNQLENYVSRLRQSADTISDLISNLILKIKSVEQAPVERAKFNELKDVFVKAENKERDHKAEEASLKQRLEEAKAKTTTFKQEIDRLNTQVKSSSEVVAAQKQKFEQISKQHEDAKNELEKAESELAQLNGDS